MGNDAAELVNKVKDQVRSRQKRMSNVAESGEEHSIIWGMFMAATMNAATFMGKNFSTIQNFIMNSRDLTLKQLFDITAKLDMPAATFPTAILFFPQESNLRCREDLRKALRLDRQQRKQEHVVSFHVKAYLWDKKLTE